MTHGGTETSQRIAARIAGVTLLVLMLSGFLGLFARGGHLIVSGDAVATARNILAHMQRFRVGLLCEFVMLNCDIVLALALFALLKPVNSALALLGSFWRVANAFLLAVGIAGSLVSLELLNDVHSVSRLSSGQLDGTAIIMFFGLHKQASLLGLMFFCLGAGVHSWLLFQSKYIPRAISGLYLFAAVEMLICCIAFIVFPMSRAVLDPGFVVPDFVAELATALWLTIRGVKLSVREGANIPL